MWYILLRKKEENMAYILLFYEWTNKMMNKESVKRFVESEIQEESSMCGTFY